MKRFVVLIVLFIAGFSLYGQTDTLYYHTYGGIQNDVCNQIKPTYDKGYIMIGTTNSFGCGNTGMYAVKIDSLGKHEWSESYGGGENQEGFSVAPTFDHGYAFVGLTDSYGAGGYDVFLVRTDSVGKLLWQKTYGGSDWDFGYSIQQLADSGFIICGQTYSYGGGNGDVYVVRTDKNGDTVWTRAIGGAGYDVGNAICVEKDSLYAIIGNTTSFGLGDTNVYFILMDDKGIIKKDTTYGCTHSSIGNSINETIDHGFVGFGATDSIESGKLDEMMIKIDSVGTMQWLQIYHSQNGNNIGQDALQAADGSYLAVSSSYAGYGYGPESMRTWHMNSSGVAFSAPSLGGVGYQVGNSIAIGKNGNVVFAGASNSSGFTVGLYNVMIARWINDDSINNIRYNDTTNFHDTCLCISATGVSQIIFYPEVKVYPNPVSSSATLLIQGEAAAHYFYNVYNGAGECIMQRASLQSISHGQYAGYFEKDNLAAGVYIYEILNQAGAPVATGKFIIE